MAPLNGARGENQVESGRKQQMSQVPRVWDMALCGRCLPRPPPTAGRGATATVPRPVPIAVPRLPSILLHGAGVRPRSLTKRQPGHAPSVNAHRRPSFLCRPSGQGRTVIGHQVCVHLVAELCPVTSRLGERGTSYCALGEKRHMVLLILVATRERGGRCDSLPLPV